MGGFGRENQKAFLKDDRKLNKAHLPPLLLPSSWLEADAMASISSHLVTLRTAWAVSLVNGAAENSWGPGSVRGESSVPKLLWVWVFCQDRGNGGQRDTS